MRKYVNGEYIEMTDEEIEAMQSVEVPPEEEIERLKQQLEDTDYKIIKCYEYSLVGEHLPYDVKALHGERQALRDRIAELEVVNSEPQ